MTETGRPTHSGAGAGALCVLAASLLWGTTGTSATFAPDVGPLAIGAVAMGLGGLLQALIAAPRVAAEAARLRTQRGVVLLGALAVGTYPLAFYSSMHLAGVAAGTVVSIGSAPLASAVIERLADGRRLTRRGPAGATLGLLSGRTYALYSWAAHRLIVIVHERLHPDCVAPTSSERNGVI